MNIPQPTPEQAVASAHLYALASGLPCLPSCPLCPRSRATPGHPYRDQPFALPIAWNRVR